MRIAGTLGMIAAMGFGCATYQNDYRVIVSSAPPGAEVWKGDYYLGRTPYTFHCTATWEDKERGYIRLPSLVLKKAGFRERRFDLSVDLEGPTVIERSLALTPASDLGDPDRPAPPPATRPGQRKP